MRESDGPSEYAFQGATEEGCYRLFPDELENNDYIFFHGTGEKNLASILEKGFIISGQLSSISFSRNSSLSLKYACDARSESSPRGVVIAAQFDSLNKPQIVGESFGLHVYGFDIQPRIIGYLFVPEDYRFQ